MLSVQREGAHLNTADLALSRTQAMVGASSGGTEPIARSSYGKLLYEGCQEAVGDASFSEDWRRPWALKASSAALSEICLAMAIRNREA